MKYISTKLYAAVELYFTWTVKCSNKSMVVSAGFVNDLVIYILYSKHHASAATPRDLN